MVEAHSRGDVGCLLREQGGAGGLTESILSRERREYETDSRCTQQGAERHHRAREAKKLGMAKTCSVISCFPPLLVPLSSIDF